MRGRGIPIDALPGDAVGLHIGLSVDRDFCGAPVSHPPGLGAIEAE